MIEFRDVSFSYPDGAEGGLKHIDLTIPDGQCVLLCGSSGRRGRPLLSRSIGSAIDYEFVCRTCTRILHLADGGIREDLTMAEGSLPTIKGLFGVQ